MRCVRLQFSQGCLEEGRFFDGALHRVRWGNPLRQEAGTKADIRGVLPDT